MMVVSAAAVARGVRFQFHIRIVEGLEAVLFLPFHATVNEKHGEKGRERVRATSLPILKPDLQRTSRKKDQ